MRRAVVATAGHVDHGKSTLVRALTGTDPDRLAEERRRGLTIDLGFAWTSLASGTHLAFVDVPGHERFIANMLAGLGPAPAVLFVVAADGGWERQSAEHLAAVDALGVRHGLLAVTRSDLTDPGPARTEALERIARSSLGTVPSVVVSGRTGDGLDDLRRALDDLVGALPPPDAGAPVRLWIDRSFSIRGAGTVVTGTLPAGTLRTGDRLEIGGREVTVRGLESAGRKHTALGAVARVAVNLRGVAPDDVSRGDPLLTPGAWHRTATADVALTAALADELPAELVLHVGSAAVPVHVRPLGERHARLTWAQPLPLRSGDRAVLRDPGRHAVAAGVEVVDAEPPALRRRGAGRERAGRLARGPLTAGDEVARRGVVSRAHLERLGLDTSPLGDRDGWLVDPAAFARWVQRARPAVEAWARRNPLEPAVPGPALARSLGVPAELLGEVVAAAGLAMHGGRVGSVAPDAGPGVRALVERLRQDPFRAPEAEELATLRIGRKELAAAERLGLLIRLDGVVLLPDAPRRAADRLRDIPQPFTLSEARQALGTTRRVAVPLLEHLDEIGATQRLDERLRRVGAVDALSSGDRRRPGTVRMDEAKDGSAVIHEVKGARIEVTPSSDTAAELVLAGEFDFDNSDAIEHALAAQLDAGRTHLTLHAAGVTFMDSTVLAVLLRVYQRCVAAGGSFALADASTTVARLVETTGLDQIMRPNK